MILYTGLAKRLFLGMLRWLYQCFFKKYCNFFDLDGKEC